MKRNYEGTIRLQEIGIVEGIKAKNIRIGDELVWNFGGTSKVIAIEFSKTGKTLIITTEYVNYSGEVETFERRLNAERIVAVKELNPVEEVAEVKTAEEEIEELEELIVVKSDELTEIQKQIEKAESTEERYNLRDVENQLKWEIWSMVDLLQEKREELGLFEEAYEPEEPAEAIEVLEEAKKFLELTKKFKDSKFYCEGQGFYQRYKKKYKGKEEIFEFKNPMWLVEFLKE